MGTSVEPRSIGDDLAAIRAQGNSVAPKPRDIATDLAAIRGQHPGNPGGGLLGGVESGLQGMLGGFADELGGAGAAGIDAIDNKLHGLPADFGKNYRMYRDTARGLDKGFEESHPWEHAGTEIAGSIPTMILTGGAGEAGEALGLANRMRGAISTGAKVGAVYGAGNAEGGLAERAKGASVGAVEGGALGALAPAVGATISHVPKVLQATTGIGTKEVALQKMAELLKESGMSVPEFVEKANALKAAGAPVVAGEVPGDLGRRYIEFVTGQPSAKGLDLGTKLAERHAGQYDRVTSGLKDAMGQDFINVPQTEEALVEAQKAHAQPNYQKAYASGPFNSPNLQAAQKIPEFQKALEMGKTLAYHDDVLQAMKNGSTMPPPPESLAGGASRGKFRSQTPQGVSIKALDYAKRYLDNGINRGFESSSSFNTTSAGTTNGILKQILSEVDAANPDYAKARSIYSSDARMREVMDLGKGALNMPPEELGEAIKSLSPEELNLARQRFMSAVRDKAGNVNDRNDLTKQLLQNPNVKQRFEIMSPNPEAMQTLSALKERESGMARTHYMSNTGSPTAPRLATSESMQSVVGPADIGIGVVSPRRMGMRLIGDAGKVVQRHTSKALADEMAPMLGSEPGTPEFEQLVRALRSQGKGVQALADNHHFLHAVTKSLAGVGSQNQNSK